MTFYLLLKIIHVISATVIFGTGLGTAFHMYMTHRSGDARAIAVAARNTVRADWLFTTPAIVVQPASGIWLAALEGYSLASGWILAALLLYVIAGACWLPVVWLQMRAERLSRAAVETGAPLPPAYYSAMRIWFWLGWPAFVAMIATFWLMIAKPNF